MEIWWNQGRSSLAGDLTGVQHADLTEECRFASEVTFLGLSEDQKAFDRS